MFKNSFGQQDNIDAIIWIIVDKKPLLNTFDIGQWNKLKIEE